MHIQPTRRSSLFLLELMIAILFFSLSAAVCVRFFVKSHTLETQSMDLNHAVTAATSAAEILRSAEDPYNRLLKLFPSGDLGEDTFQIYYDFDWNPCTASKAAYRLILKTEYTESFLTGSIQVYKNKTSLYTLTIEKYLTKEASL